MALTSTPAARLAARLRELREQEWPDANLTQAQLATALSRQTKVASATLSSWESVTNPKTPPWPRLSAYARFFATERSLEGAAPHLLDTAELTAEESARAQELEAEFRALLHHEGADDEDPRRTPLHFTAGPELGPVVLLCPELPEEQWGPLADNQSPNYTELHRYADTDALLQVFGHIRALNPRMHVLPRIASTVANNELQNHVVLLGGVGWNRATRAFLRALDALPFEQISDESVKGGEIFRMKKSHDPDQETFYPVMEADEATGKPELVEDVALIARLGNPFNTSRTLTVFNGVHSRGVVGAVLALTDETVRPSNEQYLADRFPSGSFAMLVKVPVIGGNVLAPDIGNPAARILQWSPDQGVVE